MNLVKRVSSGAQHRLFPPNTKPISNESDAGKAVMELIIPSGAGTTLDRHTHTCVCICVNSFSSIKNNFFLNDRG